MSTLYPYLMFNGNCLEAMEFYKDCFEGQLTISTYGEMPTDDVRDEDKNLVMLAKLSSHGIILLASDRNSNREEVNFGSNITIYVDAEKEETARKYFDHLADGGNITMPFEETLLGTKSGLLTDKYGLHWLINFNLKK
jgi:PhnB protein